jgi:hypothetical protein
MRKLMLQLDDLKVSSFITDDGSRGRGTIRALSVASEMCSGVCNPNTYMCGNTDAGCPGTLWWSGCPSGPETICPIEGSV